MIIGRGRAQGGATDPYGGVCLDDPAGDDYSHNAHEPTKPDPRLKIWRPCRHGLLCSLPNSHLGSCNIEESLELITITKDEALGVAQERPKS
jgi:hypothetical protein